MVVADARRLVRALGAGSMRSNARGGKEQVCVIKPKPVEGFALRYRIEREFVLRERRRWHNATVLDSNPLLPVVDRGRKHIRQAGSWRIGRLQIRRASACPRES